MLRWYVLPLGRIQHVAVGESLGAIRSPCGTTLPAVGDLAAGRTMIAADPGFDHLHSCGRCHRRAQKLRRIRPERRKLSDDDVLAVRRRYAAGEYVAQLAGEFGVEESYCLRLIRGDRRGGRAAVKGSRKPRRVDSWAKAGRR